MMKFISYVRINPKEKEPNRTLTILFYQEIIDLEVVDNFERVYRNLASAPSPSREEIETFLPRSNVSNIWSQRVDFIC